MSNVRNIVLKGARNPQRGARYAKRKVTRPIAAVKRRIRYRGVNVDPLAHVWVDVDSITDCVIGGESESGDYHADVYERFQPMDQDWGPRGEPVGWGGIEGGGWDRNRVQIEELLTYKGCYEHFVEDVPWRETTLLQTHIERIESGYTSMGFETVEGILNRYDYVDDLYRSLVEKGYLSQPELGYRWQPHREIIVNLDRNGELVFNGQGRHRLALAKILDLDQVAVSILVRHSDVIYGTSSEN